MNYDELIAIGQEICEIAEGSDENLDEAIMNEMNAFVAKGATFDEIGRVFVAALDARNAVLEFAKTYEG